MFCCPADAGGVVVSASEGTTAVAVVSAGREKRAAHAYPDGKRTYTGEWVGECRDGQGVLSWADGAKYEGQWSNDKAEGQGKFTHADGAIYDGAWVADKANGSGTLVEADGTKYEGQWKDDA